MRRITDSSQTFPEVGDVPITDIAHRLIRSHRRLARKVSHQEELTALSLVSHAERNEPARSPGALQVNKTNIGRA
jgi:hypothetical protein